MVALATGSAGQVLQSGGASADPVYSTATYPATATGTGKILRADGTNWAATTATYPNTAGTSGNVLTSDGTNWSSVAPASSAATANSVLTLVDDFFSLGDSGTTQLLGQQCWLTRSTNSWLPRSVTNSTNPGQVANASFTSNAAKLFLGSTTTATFRPCIILGGGAISINWVIQMATLSNATNRYIFRMGLGDTSNADQANGVYFEYSDNINSGNWVGKTAAASSRTPANSAVAADTNWHNFGITINAAATSCSFFIDGVQIANSPLSATIPTLAVSPFVDMPFVAGTIAAASVNIDLFYFTQTLTTAR